MELESKYYNSEVNKHLSNDGEIEFSCDARRLYLNKRHSINKQYVGILLSVVNFAFSIVIILGLTNRGLPLMLLCISYCIFSLAAMFSITLFDDFTFLKNKLLGLQTFDFDMTMLNPDHRWKLPLVLDLYKDFQKASEYHSLLKLINNKDYQKIDLILSNTNPRFLKEELLKEYNKSFVEQTLEARDMLNGESTKSERVNNEFLDNLIALNPHLSIMKHLDKNLNEMEPVDKSNYQKIHSTLMEAHEIIKNSDYIASPESKSKDMEKFNKLVKISLPTLNDIKKNLHDSKSDKLDVAAIYLSDALNQPLQIEGNLHKVDDVIKSIKNEEKIEEMHLKDK